MGIFCVLNVVGTVVQETRILKSCHSEDSHGARGWCGPNVEKVAIIFEIGSEHFFVEWFC